MSPDPFDSDTETPEEREARLHDLSRERAAPERIQRSDDIEELRTNRAQTIEDTRAARASNVEERRQERAIEVAVQQARREVIVDTMLTDHGKHLSDINGSTEKTARALEAQNEILVGFRIALHELKDDQTRRDAAARDRDLEKLSQFQKVGLAVGSIVGVLALIVSIVATVHP